MRVVDIIGEKRDKKNLKKEEINFLLEEYKNGDMPDYQMSAFLMAVYFNGMNKEEIFAFTENMTNSGDIIDIENKKNIFIVDKHSTGGVGDKTTVALLPIFADLGIGTLKLSGRGLGHTGGTIDKLESIKGFEFPKDIDGLKEKFYNTDMGIMGYNEKIVPLDKKIYYLRDVTATVASLPLIASSVMSKKLAVKSDAIILDVKVGNGAFIKTIEEAEKLADIMIDIGKNCNRKMVAVLTNMEEPLGKYIGNALEIKEVIETLKGRGPDDLNELLIKFSAIALVLSNIENDYKKAEIKAKKSIESGSALKKFEEFIKEYGGNTEIIEDYSKLEISDKFIEVETEKEGIISEIEAELIGIAAMKLGAGRQKKEDNIDYGVGIELLKKTGETVKKYEKICRIFYKNIENLDEVKKDIINAYKISEDNINKKDIILKIKGEDILECE